MGAFGAAEPPPYVVPPIEPLFEVSVVPVLLVGVVGSAFLPPHAARAETIAKMMMSCFI